MHIFLHPFYFHATNNLAYVLSINASYLSPCLCFSCSRYKMRPEDAKRIQSYMYESINSENGLWPQMTIMACRPLVG